MTNEKIINVICLINNELNKSPLTPEGISVLGKMELIYMLDVLITELKQIN